MRSRAEPWDEGRIEALAARVDLCGRAIAQLGARFQRSADAAASLVASLRGAGQALAFLDEDDGDASSAVIERLEILEREANELLTLWQDDVTREYPSRLLWEARRLGDDEPTRVRPRIVPPARVVGGRGAAARSKA